MRIHEISTAKHHDASSRELDKQKYLRKSHNQNSQYSLLQTVTEKTSRNISQTPHVVGAHGSVAATSWKVAGSIPDEVNFFNLPNPSSRTIVLGSTQSLTEMSTRNLPGGKGRQGHKAENFTAICDPIV
jgi:hypothetical protein